MARGQHRTRNGFARRLDVVPRPRTYKSSVRVVLSLGIVLGLGVNGTLAYFTDAVAVSGTTIKTGELNLKVNGTPKTLTWTDMNTSTLRPGNSTAGVMNVRNTGTGPLTYYVHSSATNTDGKGLGGGLVVKVTGNATTTGAAPNKTCSGTALSGTGITFASNLVGSAASPRLLASGQSEDLCIQATLPSDAPASLSSASTNIRFDFAAETSPASNWTDSLAATGITLGTAAIGAAPTISCSTVNSSTVTISWPAMSGATGYRLFYGADGTTVEDVPASTLSKSFTNPAMGTMWVQAMYGSTSWLSGNSNTRTYQIDTMTGTCV